MEPLLYNPEGIDFEKNNNGIKDIAIMVAGPISGFLGSYGLAKVCSANSYFDSANLFKLFGLGSLDNLFPEEKGLDGYRIAKRLKKLGLPYKWYFFTCYLGQLLFAKKAYEIATSTL